MDFNTYKHTQTCVKLLKTNLAPSNSFISVNLELSIVQQNSVIDIHILCSIIDFLLINTRKTHLALVWRGLKSKFKWILVEFD